jgi:putative transposase
MAKKSCPDTKAKKSQTRSVSHKIALNPNNVQRNYMARAAGCARFAYNWALAEWDRQYKAWQADNSLPKPDALSISRDFTITKRIAFPWILEVPQCSLYQSIRNLGKAFDRFYKKVSSYPKFHKKGARDSFYIANSEFAVDGDRIRIPKLGWVRMFQSLRYEGKIMSATVSRTADRWFVSINVETTDPLTVTENQGTVGVDLGIRCLATLSNGKRYENPRPLENLLFRLRRLSRRLSRKVKGSKNWHKAKAKIARLHARIANVRRDKLHWLTTKLSREYGTIVIEDLDVKGMMSVPYMARKISDVGFYDFRSKLTYKTGWRGVNLIVADRDFPSSQLCSSCGFVNKDLTLSQVEWKCPKCGQTHDRDLNAAINLEKYAGRYTSYAS